MARTAAGFIPYDSQRGRRSRAFAAMHYRPAARWRQATNRARDRRWSHRRMAKSLRREHRL